MKKYGNTIGYNKSRAKLVAQQKKVAAAEAGLEARKTRAVRAIAIGSAALGIITLSLFAAKKLKKKRGIFS